MDTEEIPRSIESYQVVILPDVRRLSDAQCKLLDQYVEHGGKLLVTGFTSTGDAIGNPLGKIRLKSLGTEAEYKTFEKVQGTYYRIFQEDKQQLQNKLFDHLDLVYAWEEGLLCQINENARGYLGYIPPAMIGPPEKCYYTEVTRIPGLIYNQFGEGKTAFFPFKLGSIYHHKRHYGHAALVISALKTLLDYNADVQINASPMVEISRQIGSKGDFEWYALLNHSGQLGNGFYAPVPVRNLTLKFKPQKPVKAIRGLIDGRELSFDGGTDLVEITMPELEAYNILLVEYQ